MHAKVSDAAGRSDPHQFGSEPFCLLRSLPHGHPEDGSFDALSLGLHVPLSTLRVRPHERPRMTRGRCGWLGLHRNGLSPSTSCRFLRRTNFKPETSNPLILGASRRVGAIVKRTYVDFFCEVAVSGQACRQSASPRPPMRGRVLACRQPRFRQVVSGQKSQHDLFLSLVLKVLIEMTND